MAITSDDIQNQSFSIDRKGYDVDEVDVFLERMANEVDAMNAQIAGLQNQLEEAESKAQESATAIETRPIEDYDTGEKDAKIAALEKKLEERRRDDNAIAQALITAQRSGDEIIANAKNVALTTQQDAEDEAKRILDKANSEKQRVLSAITDLQDDREQTREDYQDMLKDFISSATKKLTEIGGDAPSSNAFQTTGRVASHSRFASDSLDASTATYTTPQNKGGSVMPASPTPSQPEKDLSGFGDADDAFEFGDVE